MDNRRPRLPAGQGRAVDGALVDLNGDGLLDLVRATATDWGVFLQDRAGGFQAVSVPNPGFPGQAPDLVQVTTGKFASGVYPDVVVAYRDGTVRIFPNSRGTFGTVWQLPVIAGSIRPSLSEVLVGDLDGNGRDDLVVTLDQERPVVFEVVGANQFQQRRIASGPLLVDPLSVLVDLNADGAVDLVSATRTLASAAPPVVWRNLRGVLALDANAFAGIPPIAAAGLSVTRFASRAAVDVVLVPASPSPAPVLVYRNRGTGGALSYALTTAGTNVQWAGVQDAVVRDVNRDGFDDVCVIDGAGAVQLALHDPLVPGRLVRPRNLVPAARSRRLLFGDLEGDGDLDLCLLGAGIEDRLFLGDGSANLTEVDTEGTSIPIREVIRPLFAVLDLNLDGDPDLAAWNRAGVGLGLLNVDGQARFESVGPLPVASLPSGGEYLAAEPASIVQRGRVDGVLVLGRVSASNPTGLRVLVQQSGGRLADETLQRYAGSTNWTSMTVADVLGGAGSRGVRGLSDVVVLDASGLPAVIANLGGRLQLLGPVTTRPVSLSAQILVADLNLDQRPDLILVDPRNPVRILLADPAAPDRFIEGPALSIVAYRGLVADLNGDLIPDLVLASGGAPTRLNAWTGQGAGKFADETLKTLPRVGLLEPCPDLQVIRAEGRAELSLVVAQVGNPELLLRQSTRGGAFAGPEELPIRGSVAARRLLVSDLDVDGDDDVLVVRADTNPALLLGQTFQFTHGGGFTQVGRETVLHVSLPDATTLGAVGIGFPVVRFPLPGLGVLRLSRISVILPVPSPSPQLVHEIRLPIPAGTGLTPIPMQLFTIDGFGALKFRNLDHWAPTGR